MEGSETSPNMVADDSSFAGAFFLDTPATLWKISCNIIEEIWLEDSIVFEELFLLLGGLDISEVHVAVKLKSHINA